MSMFYCPQAAANSICFLDETESRHLSTVLRKQQGEEIHVFDGMGNLYAAQIDMIGKKETSIYISNLLQTENKDLPKLHIAIAPSKNIERFEWFVEKATEIGIAEITPLLCKHSERKELRLDRIEKILVGACKQSGKLTIPKLNALTAFNKVVTNTTANEQKFIAYCHKKSVHLKQLYKAPLNSLILIGPEGDFSKEELDLATEQNFETVSLGQSRLRLETAGIYATTVFNLANEFQI